MVLEHNPGDYYREKRKEAERLREQIKQTTDPTELKRLRRLLDMAEYTGD